MTFEILKMNWSFIIFCVVGGVSAIVDVLSLILLSKYLLINDNISITLAFLLGLLVNYFLHTYLTFKSTPTKSNLAKFMIVVAVNYLLTILLIHTIISVSNFDIVIAKIITLPVIAIIGYITSKIWVYNE
ncbi:GtrA family protein [Vibrio sp. 10N.261.51.F11]|uniref:GtrA family protein n=1 Tax=Vibrio sp. 10N.261.51.F11 TaxID=3229678 RepID=UPI00354C519E